MNKTLITRLTGCFSFSAAAACLLLLLLVSGSASAQRGGSAGRQNEQSEALNDIYEAYEKTGYELDRFPYAVSMEVDLFNAYLKQYNKYEELKGRLVEINNSLNDQLDKQQATFIQYRVSLEAKIMLLEFCHERSRFIDFIKLSIPDVVCPEYQSQVNFKQYADQRNNNLSVLKDKEQELLSLEENTLLAAKRQAKRAQDIAEGEELIDVKYINCLLDYYGGNAQAAINNLTRYQAALKSRIDSAKTYSARMNQQYAAMKAWAGYLQLKIGNTGAADSLFSNLRGFSEGDRFAAYASIMQRKFENAKSKNAELKYNAVQIPNSNRTFSEKILDISYHKSERKYSLLSREVHCSSNPALLAEILDSTWVRLSDYNTDVLKRALEVAAYTEPKELYMPNKTADKVFLPLLELTGGAKEKAVLLYASKLSEYMAILSRFMYLRESYSNLIKKNPTDYYLHLCRLKTDLGLILIRENKEPWLAVLPFIESKDFQASQRAEISEFFNYSVDTEIEDDMKLIEKQHPESYFTKLAKAEYLTFQRKFKSQAIKYIDKLNDEFQSDQASTFENMDALAQLTALDTYLLMMQKSTAKVKTAMPDIEREQRLEGYKKALKTALDLGAKEKGNSVAAQD